MNRNHCFQLPAATVLIFLSGVLLSSVPTQAASPLAYVGPGAGLTTIGALLAVAAMFFLALLGPILYPIRLIRRRMAKKTGDPADGSQTLKDAE